MYIGVNINDDDIKNIIKDIKSFTVENNLKLIEVRYSFDIDSYERRYTIKCYGRSVQSISYFDKEIKFANKLCEKYELDQIYFEDGSCNIGQNFCITVECIKEFKI